MTPTNDLSIVSLVLNASIVVQCILAILLAMSVWSWTLIFKNYFLTKSTLNRINAFETQFWKGGQLDTLYQETLKKSDRSIEENLFVAGMSELLKSIPQGNRSVDTTNNVSRAMRAAYTREMHRFENDLPKLGTIAASAPFIGLFGTVWGIMNAFTGLAGLDNVNLAVVAPGIAEALVATAIGLFAAIPASMAFNYFSNTNNIIANRLDGFSEEFLNIVERQTTKG